MKNVYFKRALVIFSIVLLLPALSYAGVESSLTDMKMKLTTVILPLLAVIGIAIGAISFFTGHPNSKQHIVYAILGCVFGFGAQAIVDFIASTIH